MLHYATWFENKAELDECIDIARNRYMEVDERLSYCIKREKGHEYLRCLALGMSVIAYDNSGNPLFARYFDDGDVAVYKKPVGKKGIAGLPSVARRECDLIEWPDTIYPHLPADYFKRNVRIALCPQVINALPRDGSKFIKTLSKGFSFVSSKDNYVFWSNEEHDYIRISEGSFGYGSQLKGGAIISDYIDFKKGGEYRCFVINGQVASVGQYANDYIRHDTPVDVRKFCADVAKKVVALGFKYFVVDVGITASGDIVIVEFNPIESAGRFFNNDFDKHIELMRAVE